jgi:hypothetical protein
VLLLAGSVELGTVDFSESRMASLELPEHVIRRLEEGWASVLPICEPCLPSNTQCGGFQYCIERIWIVGVS